ncbi:Meiotically up-regulated gene protein [Cladobotryum mycophilum]|uniref:Meiotically up-regulated gene protein n=1 Tax=Cladobotryum mycophilum TaxID=491253 RepID=A0ABR0SGI7_9HYPO
MGLVSYASSDEESDDERPLVKNEKIEKVKAQATAEPPAEAKKDGSKEEAASKQQNESRPEEPAVLIGPVTQSATMTAEQTHHRNRNRPTPPTALSSMTSPYPRPQPGHPALATGLTTPGANKKFEQFLELKKRGTHFNAKLEQSAALKNPSLMDKLLAFVDVDEASQYETTLPSDLWDPKAFPDWAFRDRLKKTREKMVKEKEAEKASGGRSSVDFAPSANLSSGNTVLTGGWPTEARSAKAGGNNY